MPTSMVDSLIDFLHSMQLADDGSYASHNQHCFKLMAVGVADTGCGLSQEMLNKAEAGLYNSDNSQGTSSGAKNSGFGLHLAIQLAGTLGTKIYLADLAQCHGVLNADIQMAFERIQSNAGDHSSVARGTVLYVVIPIIADEACHSLNSKPSLPSLPVDSTSQVDANTNETLPKSPIYKFAPQCANSGSVNTDSFRILLADDVLMLRKGLTRSLLQLFEQIANCPVQIYTACTAEDTLRMISSEPFDMVISDNQFAPPTGLQVLEKGSERPNIKCKEDSKQLMRRRSSIHFQTEAFTIEEGDGDLSGLQALSQILDPSLDQQQSYPHPTPILILLSGHKFVLPASSGIIVTQKPLRRQDIVPLLEAHVQLLIDSGICIEEEDENGSMCRVVNHRGVQIFSRNGDA